MTAIKPPGAPGSTGATSGPDAASDAARPGTARFADAVEKARGAQAPQAAVADPAQQLVADLRAGRISADDAVRALTDLAVRRSGAPEGARAAVAEQVRAFMSRDPVVGQLIARMGARVPSEK